MKKIFILLLSSLFLFGLTACSSDNNTPAEEVVPKEETEELEDGQSETEEIEPGEEKIEDSETTDDQLSIPEEITDFTEAEIVASEIDLTNKDISIETDNSNKRVILYRDNDQSNVHKSIFIKRENRLKIINENDDGLIYNEVIR